MTRSGPGWVGGWPWLLALVGCAAPPPPAATHGPPTIALLTVDTATAEVPFALPAQLYVEHDAVVYARATGIVESVYVDLGTPVALGQLMAELEHVDQEIALAQAEQAYGSALRDVERTRTLMKSHGLTTVDSEQAEVGYQHATLAQRQTQRNFDLTRVVAPFAGVVSARSARPGRLVNPGDSLFRVSALAPLRASVRVPEGGAGGIGIGSPAQVETLDGSVVAGAVIRTSPTIDAASGTREIIIELARGAQLRPGASVVVRVGAERRRVVAVPPGAVAPQGYVLVWENGRTVVRPVTLGPPLRDGRIVVTSGLSAGDQIVRDAK